MLQQPSEEPSTSTLHASCGCTSWEGEGDRLGELDHDDGDRDGDGVVMKPDT